MKYPPRSSIDDLNKREVVILLDATHRSVADKVISINEETYGNSELLKDKTLSQWLRENNYFLDPKSDIDIATDLKLKSLMIGGQEAIQVSVTLDRWEHLFTVVYVQAPNKKRVFSIGGNYEDPINQKILSTFEFLEEIDTSNWKTYEDKIFPFAFKYPSTWKPEATKDTFGIPTIHLSKISTIVDSQLPEVYIGGLRAQTICSDTSCVEDEIFAAQIEGRQINTPTYKVVGSGIYKLQFELPTLFQLTPSKTTSVIVPTMTASFRNDQDKEEIARILSTLKFTHY